MLKYAGVIRYHFLCCFNAYELISDHACKVTYLSYGDMKGNLPQWIVNKVVESPFTSLVQAVQYDLP